MLIAVAADAAGSGECLPDERIAQPFGVRGDLGYCQHRRLGLFVAGAFANRGKNGLERSEDRLCSDEFLLAADE